MNYLLLFFFFGISAPPSANEHPAHLNTGKTYQKAYYPDGTLKEEGWAMGTMKMGYWIMYHPNGILASKGHFSKNKKEKYWYYFNPSGELVKEGHYKKESAEDWWIFYYPKTSDKIKIQFKENKKHGYALRYQKRKLVKVERFENDEKTGEWTSVIAFKIDNPGVTW